MGQHVSKERDRVQWELYRATVPCRNDKRLDCSCKTPLSTAFSGGNRLANDQRLAVWPPYGRADQSLIIRQAIFA